MTNNKRQEIIDYLEQGDKFSMVLISELNRTDITCYEKRTYSSLLDALNGADELYCAMTKWPDNVAFITAKHKGDKLNKNDGITINHGVRTLNAVQQVSDYLKDIPLSSDQNDMMTTLMKDLLLTAEHETYMQGFADCMKVVQDGGFKGLEDKIVKMSGFNS